MALTKIDDRGLKTPIDLQDNEKIRFGTDNDLELYHDGSNSYIKDVGTGNLLIDQSTANVLYLRSDDLRLSTWTGTETYIDCNVNGSVELYYDGSKKLETRSNGISIHGNQIDLKRSSTTDQETIFYYGSSYLDIETREATGIRLKTNKQDRLIIDSSGKVGIGTSALSSYNGSSDDLVIDNGAADAGITLDSEGQCSIAFTDSAKTGWDGWVKYVHSDNHLEFGGNGNTRLTINSSGHISMGVATAPLTSYHGNTGTLFTIYDSNANAGVLELAGENNQNAYNAGSIAFINNANANAGTPWDSQSKYVALLRAQLVTSDGNAGDDSGADLVLYRKPEAEAGTESVRFKSTGDVSIADGNLVVASGHGIDFSATSDATGKSSELLDDYEEGTWTPNFYASSGSDTWNNGCTGCYTKIGNQVTVHWSAQYYSGDLSGSVYISGLPYANNFRQYGGDFGIYDINAPSDTIGKMLFFAVGSVLALYWEKDNDGGSQIQGSEINSGAYIEGNFTYRTA